MLRYKIFRSLHSFLYKIEYCITYPGAVKAAKLYQQCAAKILGYTPPYAITDSYREGTAIATLMIREHSLYDQDRIHDAVEKQNPKLLGGIIFDTRTR